MKITADYIFSEDGYLLKDKYIETDENGTIVQLGNCPDGEDIELLNGIIVPGFFNCHSHLELADARLGHVNDLNEFLTKMKTYWDEPTDINNKKREIAQLDRLLYHQGVEFCADVSNTNLTIDTKRKSKITYYNFIEVFEKLFDDPLEVFSTAQKIKKNFLQHQLQASIVPHSLYSISDFLIEILFDYNTRYQEYSSIHFKENFNENQLHQLQLDIYNPQTIKEIAVFNHKFQSGDLLAILNEVFDKSQRVVFVHNIYMNEKEAVWILKHLKNSAFCICPASNMNLEKKMINIEILKKFGENIFLGTDSMASNENMSFINEMYLMQENYNFCLEEVFKISSHYPSVFFQQLGKGKISPGNQPGLVLLSNLNMREMKLTSESKSVRIV